MSTIRRFVVIIITSLFFAANGSIAQVTPPTAYPTTKTVNYVRTWDATAPVQTLPDLITRPVTDVKQTTVYTDGLGRTLQTVSKQLSPGKNDMVVASTYDLTTGNEIYKYLPFSSTVAQASDYTYDGNLKIDPFQQQVAFYNTQMQASGQTGEYNVGASNLNWAYGQVNFENSPLNRPLSTYAPGSSWVGASHAISGEALVNTAADNVQIWNIGVWSIAAPQSNIIPANGGVYAAGQLYKLIAVDEVGHQTITYTDKDGHTILKKVQLTATADAGTGSDHPGWLCTYYVYDDYDNLRFIITPKLVNLIYSATTWGAITQQYADELCYRFEYDVFNHNIIKKNPGTPTGSAGEVWMVYDQRNRIVMQQDGNLRSQQKWQYIQYDGLDRPIQMGLLTDATNYNNLAYHTNLATASITYPSLASYPTNELLSQIHYDDYSGMSSTTTSTLTSSLDATTSGAGNSNFSTTYNTSPSYSQPITKTAMIRGMVIWTRTEVIGGTYTPNSKYLYSVNFYDNKGRTIQTQQINITGGQDINTIQYDFSGKALVNVLTHKMVGSSVTQTHTSVETMAYDHAGRLLTITKSLSTAFSNGSPTITAAPVVIAANSYNELGQLKQKNLGRQRDVNNNPTTTPIETLAYDYTIRGWLAGINRGYLSPGYTIPAGGGNFFGMELGYDKTASVAGHAYTASQYNGNVTGVTWKSRGDVTDRQYNYTYDNVSRLTAANFIQNTSGSTWDNSYLNFTQNGFTYDYNGNILTMNRQGFLLGSSAAIDQLTYTYTPNTNRLQSVVDAANNTTTKLGDFRSSQTYITALGGSKTVANAASYTDYTYDANGNLLKDLNKDIGTSVANGILYNFLDLPQQITITNKGNIQYVYDAAGNKLQKITTENNVTVTSTNGVPYSTTVTTTTTYVCGFVYKSLAYSNTNINPSLQYNNLLQFEGNEAGRIRYIPAVGSIAASYVFDYFIKDNQGNVRMVLTDEKQTDIYPAATMEGGIAGLGLTTTLINNEQPYYTFNNQNDVVLASSVSWFASAAGHNYYNYNGTTATTPPVNPNPNLTGSNLTSYSQYVYRLNPLVNAGDNTGLGITLKVMAGDQVSIFAKSVWHNGTGASPNNGYSLINSAIANFLGAFAKTTTPFLSSTHGVVTAATLNNAATTGPLGGILTGNNTLTNTGTAQPVKAGINWILFDDQFRPVQAGSGYDPVSGTADNVYSHAVSGKPSLTMPKNGYLYIYCSNESNVDVLFDNLQVTDVRGPILEETHLYADGLTIAAISDRAWNKQPNNYHYQCKEMQNQEFSDGSGLEEYDFEARLYDPQLGVWHNQDPDNQFASPYVAMGNSWPNGIDPSGRNFWKSFGRAFEDLAIIAAGAAVTVVSGGGALAAGLVAAGGYAGASLESGNWNPFKWDGNAWKGAITGELIVGSAIVGGEAIFANQTLVTAMGATEANIAVGAATGVGQGILTNEVGSLEKTGKLSWNWDQMFVSTVSGAITGALNAKVGKGLDGAGESWLDHSLYGNAIGKDNPLSGLTSNLLGAFATAGFKEADAKGWSWGHFFDMSNLWPALRSKLVAQPFGYIQGQIQFIDPKNDNIIAKLGAVIGKKELGILLSRFQTDLLGTTTESTTNPDFFGVFNATNEINSWSNITSLTSIIKSFFKNAK